MRLQSKEFYVTLAIFLACIMVFGCSSAPQFKITVTHDGDGAVTLTPAQASYKKGASVQIKATPDAGWEFSEWQGSLTGKVNPSNVVVDGNMTIKAVFTSLNQPPVQEPILDQTTTPGDMVEFEVKATDPENDPLTFSATGTLASYFNQDTHLFHWSPTASDCGTYTVNFIVSDGHLTAEQDVIITVAALENQPPVLEQILDQNTTPGDIVEFEVKATDPENDLLVFSATGTLASYFNQATHIFSWSPTTTDCGTHNINFIVSDGQLTDEQSVTITVTIINQPPVLNPIPDVQTRDGNLVEFTISATDPDQDSLTYSATNLPTGASFDAATHTFTWTPAPESVGSHQVTFSVTDGLLTDSKTITIMVSPSTVYVSSGQHIQDVIDQASNGMTIIVEPGTYYENIDFKGKSFTLRSTDPTNATIRETTIIDGQGLTNVVTFGGGETREAVISGFTIRNGTTTEYDYSGGAISIFQASPTITYNNIINNQESGITAHSSDGAYIANNTIKFNNAERGAGIHLLYSSNVEVVNNVVWNNNATKYGGGICIDSSSTGIIAQNNDVSNNTTDEEGGGIAIIFHSDAILQTNFIANNTAAVNGGGISMTYGSSGTIKGNYIGQNTVAGWGGGLYAIDSEERLVIFDNNTVEKNYSPSGGGGATFYRCVVNVINNVVTENKTDSRGGGVIVDDCLAEVKNNTVGNNISPNGGGFYFGFSNEAVVAGNNIYGHSTGSGIHVDGTSVVKREDGQVWPREDVPAASETTNTYSNNLPCHVDFF